jgi:hypothetical protein
MNNTIENIIHILGLLMLIVVLLGFPLMILWNWIIPAIFGLPEIGFWQAIGLNLLSAILIKPSIKINKD